MSTTSHVSTAAAQDAPARRTNTLAVVALVLSFVVSLGGVVCGHIARRQIRETGEGGAGLALAALVIGYLGLAAGLVGAIAFLALAGAGTAGM